MIITYVGSRSDFEISKDAPYLTLEDELSLVSILVKNKDILLHNHFYFPPDGRSLHEEFEDAMQEGPMEPRPRPPAAAPASPDPSASEETATETEESGDTESDSGEILRFVYFF